MALVCLSTAREVEHTLGGIAAICDLTGAAPKAVSASLARGYFPAKTFAVMSADLYRLGFTAPASLWRQVGADGVTLVPLQAPDEAAQSV